VADAFKLQTVGGTEFFRVTDDGNLFFSGTQGSTSAEGGAIYIGDDTGLFLGDDQDVKIEYDEDGTNQARVTGADWLFVDANAIFADSQGPILGTGSDFTMAHDGTDTTFDNTAVGDTIMMLGADDNTVEFKIQNNSGTDLFAVDGAGVVDLDGTLDLDAGTVTADTDAVAVDMTVNDADGASNGIAVTITTATTVHTTGVVSGVKSTVVSDAADTGGIYASFEAGSTDGGGTTPTHVVIYGADAADAFAYSVATGDLGFTVSADGMTADPETAQEAGYLTWSVGGTLYQLPAYAA